MGLFSGLFGGDSNSETKTTTEPWSGVQPYLKSGYSTFQNAAGNVPSYYPGQTYADFTPAQLGAQQGMLNYADTLQPTIQNSMGAINAGLTSWQDPASNPYLQDYVQSAIRPVTQQYQEQVLPGIRDQAEMYGGAGNRTGLAEGVAARSYMDTVGDISTNIYNNAWNQGQDTMLKSQALLPTTLNAGTLPYQFMSGVGAAQQGQEQLGINEAMNRYDYNQNAEYNRYKDYLTTLQGTPWGTQTTTGPNPNASNPLSSVLGLGALGYGGYLGWQALAGGAAGGAAAAPTLLMA